MYCVGKNRFDLVPSLERKSYVNENFIPNIQMTLKIEAHKLLVLKRTNWVSCSIPAKER